MLTIEEIKNLLQSMLDDFKEDDVEQQLHYCREIAQTIINSIDKEARLKRCQDCAYLYGDENDEWCCDCYNKFCKDIEYCDEVGE